MQEIIDEVWPKVRQRDWTKNKVDGAAGTELDITTPIEEVAGAVQGLGMAVFNPKIEKMELTSGEGPKEKSRVNY